MNNRNEDRVYYRLRTHLEMLNDRVRCLAYQQAIQSQVQDKIVLDVGCGTGILSFFAARAGARMVFAVDTDVPPGAEDVAKANGLADRVHFIQGRIQDIELPVESVDVIISEWMGGLLLMEDMLPVVLYARDRWLKPGGLLLPDRARLFLAPLEDVAGISSHQFPTVRETISTQMWVSLIDSSRFLAEPSLILDLDLHTMKEPEARVYESEFQSIMERPGTFNGCGLWFDVLFTKARPPVILSTAPMHPPTHWAQGLWILPVDIEVNEGDIVSGEFSQTKISPSSASFKVNIDLKTAAGDKERISISREIEANPSNMNSTGGSDQETAEQAMAGAYRDQECLWIGCSISFGALMAARNGAAQVNILNHSSWAELAMRQLAAQEGLTNVRFLSGVPSPEHLQNKTITLLGTADASWQALLSHIRVRRILGRADFSVRFYREESPWKFFYGFDFSPYARWDLEMIHGYDRGNDQGNDDEPGVLPVKEALLDLFLEDITGQAGQAISTAPENPKLNPGEETVYRGKAQGRTQSALYLADGEYNRATIDFSCGTVVLPLPEILGINAAAGKELQKVELIISVVEGTLCRFVIKLSGPGISIRQKYEQPLTSLGHIVRNQ